MAKVVKNLIAYLIKTRFRTCYTFKETYTRCPNTRYGLVAMVVTLKEQVKLAELLKALLAAK